MSTVAVAVTTVVAAHCEPGGQSAAAAQLPGCWRTHWWSTASQLAPLPQGLLPVGSQATTGLGTQRPAGAAATWLPLP